MGRLMESMGISPTQARHIMNVLQEELGEKNQQIQQSLPADLKPIDFGNLMNIDADDDFSEFGELEVLDDDLGSIAEPVKSNDIIDMLDELDDLAHVVEEEVVIEPDPLEGLERSIIVVRYKPDAWHGKGGVQLWFKNNQKNADLITVPMSSLWYLLSGVPIHNEADTYGYEYLGKHKVRSARGLAAKPDLGMGYVEQWNKFCRSLPKTAGLKTPAYEEGDHFRLLDFFLISSRKTTVKGLLVPAAPLVEGEQDERRPLEHFDGTPMPLSLGNWVSHMKAVNS